MARLRRHRCPGRQVGLVVAALLAAGCGSDFGAGSPSCNLEVEEASVALITQAQAVPDARWGACVDELPLGWSLRMLTPESGRAGFVLDSDRVGLGFAEVTIVDTCAPPPDARPLPGAPEGRRRLLAVEERPAPVAITIVPVASRHEAAAFALARDLADERIEGHPVSVRQASVERDVAQRVQTARGAGRFVVVVDDTSAAGTYELWYPRDDDPDAHVDRRELLDELAERVADPVLRATWWDVGRDACTVVDIDARGPSADAVVGELSGALGSYPLFAMQAYAEEHGMVLGGR